MQVLLITIPAQELPILTAILQHALQIATKEPVSLFLNGVIIQAYIMIHILHAIAHVALILIATAILILTHAYIQERITIIHQIVKPDAVNVRELITNAVGIICITIIHRIARMRAALARIPPDIHVKPPELSIVTKAVVKQNAATVVARVNQSVAVILVPARERTIVALAHALLIAEPVVLFLSTHVPALKGHHIRP